MSNSEPEAEVAEDSVATENAEVGLIFYQELQPYWLAYLATVS